MFPLFIAISWSHHKILIGTVDFATLWAKYVLNRVCFLLKLGSTGSFERFALAESLDFVLLKENNNSKVNCTFKTTFTSTISRFLFIFSCSSISSLLSFSFRSCSHNPAYKSSIFCCWTLFSSFSASCESLSVNSSSCCWRLKCVRSSSHSSLFYAKKILKYGNKRRNISKYAS